MLVGFITFSSTAIRRDLAQISSTVGSGGRRHGAEHPPGQVKAGELGQDLQLRRVDGNICRTAGQDLRTLAVDVLRLHQEGYRRTPGVQRPGQ